MRRLLKIASDELSRPNFPSIVRRMLEEHLDVQLASKTHVISLWRAITRAGYWSWSYRVSEDAWLVRLSKTPATDQENPLIKEYDRTFKTQYCQWKQHIPDLMRGKAISLPSKDEAVRFGNSARYHLNKEQFPPFKITVTPTADGEGFEVKLVKKKPVKKG